MGGGAGVNQVTISASELIRLANRIKELENTLVRIATLADSDGFESEEMNAIWMLATQATTSVGQKEALE
jgi:hypothetical protein